VRHGLAALHGGIALFSLIRPRLRNTACRVAALACLGLFVAPAVASASSSTLATCQTPAVSTPFSQWGDTNSYYLAPGGSFEGTADQVGWTLSGASLTAGNESFYVDGSGDAQSLTIDGGGSATSPYFCVDNTMASLRFFAQQVTSGGDLQLQALVQTGNGVQTVSLGDLADGSVSSWAPTQPIVGDTSGLSDGQTVQVALQFSVPASSAAWQIDDVYVDPWRSG
jgi:hypothetical protein